ncbi:MAG: glycosyltransferase family 1 protein [Candidatus Eisenbacteria bacterium]|nr:glycosyltransferase family 1 protein [Candidatus Eisenbacteria bacterium]
MRPLLFCASTQYWDETWFRKQHFMARLSRGRPVAYVEPSHSILRAPPAHIPPASRNDPFRMRVRRAGESLWIMTPPMGFPLWTRPAVSRIQHRRCGRLLRKEAARLGFDRAWLWLYNPVYVEAVPTLAPERLILDLVDDLGAYEARAETRRNMRSCVERAIASADLVLATSTALVEAYAARTRSGNISLVPNGVRGDWIDRVPGAAPAPVRDLPHPRIGFVGALFSYLDYPLMHAAARAFPEGSLALVGPVRDAAAVERLRREPNVRIVGPVPQASVPDFIASFDVCLAPFRPGPIRRAVDPLKIYEYLALGRPVVATPLESLLGGPIAEQIKFAEGPEEFVAAIRRALEDDDPQTRAARREAVRPFAWEALADRVERIVEEAERGWSTT